MSAMTPQEIVHELDKHIVGQHDAKRAVAIALAKPLAAPAGRGAAAPGDHAEEHPDDRADRRGQDRDRAAARTACRCAVHQGGGHQVHRSGLRRARRGHDHPRSRRDRDQAGARAGNAQGAPSRAGSGRGARARRTAAAAARGVRDRARRARHDDPPALPQDAARGQPRRQGDRDRGGRRRSRRWRFSRRRGWRSSPRRSRGCSRTWAQGAAAAARSRSARR